MNTEINQLLNQQKEVTRKRNDLVRTCEKDVMVLDPRISLLDIELVEINKTLKAAYNKLYQKK